MLPSFGSTEHVYESIVSLARLYFSICIQTLGVFVPIVKENLCYNASFFFYDTELKFIAETKREKTYELSDEKHHHGR